MFFDFDPPLLPPPLPPFHPSLSTNLHIPIYLSLSQESDKLTDEDLFQFLMKMRKPTAVISRRFKSISGKLKVDISAPVENMACCLTSSLWEVRMGTLSMHIPVLLVVIL